MEKNNEVLILILMEYPLTLTNISEPAVSTIVLILILMEYPLTKIENRSSKLLKGLNPYSNGIPSDILVILYYVVIIVLILILMEYPLTCNVCIWMRLYIMS